MALIKDEDEKEKDFVAERAAKPTIFLFVRADKFDRPVACFLRTLDQDLSKGRNDVQVVAVWLTDDVDMSKKYVPRARESLKLTQTTYSVFPGEERTRRLGYQWRRPPDGCRRRKREGQRLLWLPIGQRNRRAGGDQEAGAKKVTRLYDVRPVPGISYDGRTVSPDPGPASSESPMICISLAQASRRMAWQTCSTRRRQCDLIEVRLDCFEKTPDIAELLDHKPRPVIIELPALKDGGDIGG